MASQVPEEIWWLVCQDLKRQQDFKSLFNCARVSRSWASYALPLLYSIHDSTNAASDDMGTTIDGKRRWAGMWRSIILSSVGVTAYPYCLWIKSLELGDFDRLLQEDIAPDPKRRVPFFRGPMKEFEIISGSVKTKKGKPALDVQKIVEKVGDAITKFAKEASEKQNKSVQLTSLEGANLPTSLLSVWTSRLATLTTLSVRDGSVLTAEVAESIRQNCPTFRELTCYYIRGSTVDQNMSEFFQGLREDSLEGFRIVSANEIGRDALQSLMQYHSRALRSLELSSLGSTSLPFLHLLSSCQYLEELKIEASIPSPPSTWAPDGEDPLTMVAIWLKECKTLKRLGIAKLAGASKLLSDVLGSPDLRLRELDVELVDDEEAFYSSLGYQADLESLVFRSNVETADPNGARHDKLLDSICSCKKLKDLDIMQKVGIDQVQLTTEDLFLMRESLKNLEELNFDGENLTDAIFEHLAQMPSLRALYINGLSIFTYDGIKSFIEALKTAGCHRDFRLEIVNQHGDAKIPDRLENELARLMTTSLNGSFNLVYFRDPSEDDMSDLSD